MSERADESHQESCCFFSPLVTTTLLFPFKIFLRNFKIFFSIFALTTLPLSLLLFSLSLSSHPIKSHIYHLQSVVLSAPTRFEARHVWKESRADALSLLRIKALFFLPCYALSLLAGITSVHSASLACHRKTPTFSTAVAAVRLTWKRPLVTSICVYGVAMVYAAMLRTLAAVLVGSAAPKLLAAVVGTVLEIYLMAVLSMGLVVSVVEERFGFEAIRVGSCLMEGWRVYGWFLSGLIVLVTGCIGWELEGLLHSHDLVGKSYSTMSTVMIVVMIFGDKAGLVCLFGMVMLWSYVVSTVFYCECRKRKVVRDEIESFTV